MTRILHCAVSADDLTGTADVYAYYPYLSLEEVDDAESAIWIRVDNSGLHASDCHVLDVTDGVQSNMLPSGWVQYWYAIHRDGMPCVNGHVAKPIILTPCDMLSAVQQSCANLEYDLWVKCPEVHQWHDPKWFAIERVHYTVPGADYYVSEVFDDDWGKTRSPQTTPQTSQKRNPESTCIGVVEYMTPDGEFRMRNVVSEDGGSTWTPR